MHRLYFQEGKLLREVGDQFGVSRERVRQLLHKHYPEYQVLPSHRRGRYPRPKAPHQPYIPQRHPDRFWTLVDKMDNGCWLWRGTRYETGYGHLLGPPGGRRNRQVYAHRHAWELTHGPITGGEWVLHKCDNPSCVNPDHLYLGSGRDNCRDRSERSDWQWGKLNGGPADVLRDQAAQGVKVKDLADRFGVSATAVRNVMSGRTYDGIHNKAKLTFADAEAIRALVRSGMKQTAVARLYGVGHQAVENIVLGRTWKKDTVTWRRLLVGTNADVAPGLVLVST